MRNLIFLSLIVLLFKSSYASSIHHEDKGESSYHKSASTYSHQIIHNPEIVKHFFLKYNNKFNSVMSQFEVESNPIWSSIPKGWDLILESNMKIVQNQDLKLYTNGIEECIGITVWDCESKTAALFHASRMYLSEAKTDLFQRHFIDKLKEKIKNFSHTRVNLVSCYWSPDALLAIELLLNNDIPISGLRIPAALLLRDKSQITRYIDQHKVPLIYTNGAPAMALALDTATGQLGFKLNDK